MTDDLRTAAQRLIDLLDADEPLPKFFLSESINDALDDLRSALAQPQSRFCGNDAMIEEYHGFLPPGDPIVKEHAAWHMTQPDEPCGDDCAFEPANPPDPLSRTEALRVVASFDPLPVDRIYATLLAYANLLRSHPAAVAQKDDFDRRLEDADEWLAQYVMDHGALIIGTTEDASIGIFPNNADEQARALGSGDTIIGAMLRAHERVSSAAVAPSEGEGQS